MDKTGHCTKYICGYPFFEVYPQKIRDPFSSVVKIFMYEFRHVYFLRSLDGFKLLYSVKLISYSPLVFWLLWVIWDKEGRQKEKYCPSLHTLVTLQQYHK